MTNLQKLLLGVILALWGPAALLTFAVVRHDYVQLLPMGYQIMADTHGNSWTAITRQAFQYNFVKEDYGLDDPDYDRHRGDAGSDVDGYRVYPRVIVGHKSGDSGDNPNYKLVEKAGYFIIDLKTCKSRKGLTKKVWLEKLSAYGITHEPELFSPSPFGAFLGRNKPQPPYD